MHHGVRDMTHAQQLIAAHLVAALDKLVAFVADRGTKREDEETNPRALMDDEWRELRELEAKVIALHAVVADGAIPFLINPIDHGHGSTSTGLVLCQVVFDG
jgi:hypothetical protein